MISIQVGLPRAFGRADAADPMDREWTTGFWKSPVAGPVRLGRTNLAGDGQADSVNHGGPDKAVNVYPAEHYPFWAGDPALAGLAGGAFGENFTTAGADEAGVCVGDVFAVGTATVQVSQPRQPCWKLARRWRVHDLALRVQRTGRTGWYFRVLAEGEVAPGDGLSLVERPHPEWTVAAANGVMHHRKTDRAAAAELAACPALSASWRATLARRLAAGAAEDAAPRLSGPPPARTVARTPPPSPPN